MPGLISAFDSWAAWYDESDLQALLFVPVQDATLGQLRRNAPRAGRLLDVGCGTGRLIAVAAEVYPLCVGVDPCHRMLVRGRSRHVPGTRFVRARAERLPFATGAFDVVVSTMSLRHWQDAEQGLRELARVLAMDGMLVLADAEEEARDRPKHRRRRGQWRNTRVVALMSGSGLTVLDHQLAPVHGPVPRVHVISARHSPASA